MDRFEKARFVSLVGIAGNSFLFIIKIIIGIISRSQGMIADALNSASDIVSSVMTFVGNKIAGKPKDDDHPYGHGKAEYIFSMFISIVMLIVAFVIFKNSITSILSSSQLNFSWWIVVICLVTIITKLCLYFYSSRIGKIYNNVLVSANAEDHRNDVLVTISTLIGVIASLFGLYWVDGVVGMCISIWIFYTGTKILKQSFKILMDSDEDEELKSEITDLILSFTQVGHIDSLHAKPVGVEFLIVIKISVDGNMTVLESHNLASKLKYTLLEDCRIADVLVHINPL